MEKSFASKKDKWATWMLFGVFAFTFGLTYLTVPFEEIPWWVHPVLLGSVGFIFWLYMDTYTLIKGQDLIQKTGPIRWIVPIGDIKKVKKKGTHSINHGTWSMDKMDIIHKKGILSISPEDKDGLAKMLVSINSKIEVV